MRNKLLHQRLVTLEIELNRVVKANERRVAKANMKISMDEAERAYREIIGSVGSVAARQCSERLRKFDVHELAALYLMEARRSVHPTPKSHYTD